MDRPADGGVRLGFSPGQPLQGLPVCLAPPLPICLLAPPTHTFLFNPLVLGLHIIWPLAVRWPLCSKMDSEILSCLWSLDGFRRSLFFSHPWVLDPQNPVWLLSQRAFSGPHWCGTPAPQWWRQGQGLRQPFVAPPGPGLNSVMTVTDSQSRGLKPCWALVLLLLPTVPYAPGSGPACVCTDLCPGGVRFTSWAWDEPCAGAATHTPCPPRKP